MKDGDCRAAQPSEPFERGRDALVERAVDTFDGQIPGRQSHHPGHGEIPAYDGRRLDWAFFHLTRRHESGWRCRARPVPPRIRRQHFNRGGRQLPVVSMRELWRPESISTRRAAETPRCAATSSRSAAASTSSTAADARSRRAGRTRSCATSPSAAVPSCSSARRSRPGLDRRGGGARRHAVREPPLARWPAHELAHDPSASSGCTSRRACATRPSGSCLPRSAWP